MLVKPKANGFIEADKPSKVTRKGIRIIDDMPTHRIIGHLMYKHRVGLLVSSNFALVGAIVWPKISFIF